MAIAVILLLTDLLPEISVANDGCLYGIHTWFSFVHGGMDPEKKNYLYYQMLEIGEKVINMAK